MLYQVTRTLLTVMQMRYLTVLLCVGTLMCAVMVDAFNAYKTDTSDMNWPDSPAILQQRHLATTANGRYPYGLPPKWRGEQVVAPLKKRGSLPLRDPRWRLCIGICMNSCSMFDEWGGEHFMYCTENCVEIGYKIFNPEQYCFNFEPERVNFQHSKQLKFT